MKSTKLLLVAAATLTLTSCAEDEPVSVSESENSAISFRPAVGRRATETTNSNLASFYVTSLLDGSTFFENVNYTKGSDGFFNSATPYYWPGNDKELTFYAYAPSADELGGDMVIDGTTQQLQNFAVADNIADQVDFITAEGTGKKSVNETAGLELTFGHRLSQIEVRAKSDNQDFTFKVAGVRIGRAEYLGTYDFAKNDWTLDDWHDTAVYDSRCDEVTLGSDAVSIMGASGNAMLLPQTLTPWSPTNDPDNVAREAYISVYVQILSANGDVVYPYPGERTIIDPVTGKKREYAWASIPLSGTWEQGMKYVYTLDFTRGAGFVDPDDPTPGEPVLGEPIKFTVNVLPWQETDIPTSMIVK